MTDTGSDTTEIKFPDSMSRADDKRVFELVKQRGNISTDEIIDEMEEEYDVRTHQDVSDIMRRFRYLPEQTLIQWEKGGWVLSTS